MLPGISIWELGWRDEGNGKGQEGACGPFGAIQRNQCQASNSRKLRRQEMDERKSQVAPGGEKKRKQGAIVLLALIVLFIFFVVVMVINSRKPSYHVIASENVDKGIRGAHFVRVNQVLIKEMANNWLPNDLFWPTALLDNMPNFQLGELEVVRYNVRVLRDNLSRMRTTDKLDHQAEAAFTSLSNDPYKWWFPSAESRWRLAYDYLEVYYRNLASGRSQFYPRADNLIELLNQYLSLMGGANTRLINAPRDIIATLALEEQKQKAPASVVDVDIPWRQIDDNFIHRLGPQEGGKILEIRQQRVTGFPELPAALPLLVHKTHDPIA